MKIIENIRKIFLIFALVGSLVPSINAMKPTKKSVVLRRHHGEQVRRVGLETVWVRTFDGQTIEVPQWQIDQMKVLQVLFLHQKGKNSQDNPIEATMVTIEQLKLLKEAFIQAGDLGKLEQFYDNLTSDAKNILINGASVVEAQGLVSFIMNMMFSPEVQEKIGTSNITQESIIAPIIEYMMQNCRKRLKGPMSVQCAAFSPDGNYIVSGSNMFLGSNKEANNNNLTLWNAKTCEKIKDFEGHDTPILYAEFSPDGEYIISGTRGTKNNLILWNIKTGEKKVLEGHNGSITCVAFSMDGNYIISGSEGDQNNLILWNGKTGEQIKIIIRELYGPYHQIKCAAFSPDGKYIVSGSYGTQNNLMVWDGSTGEQIRILDVQEQYVNCVAFSPDSKYIVSGLHRNQNNLIIWDVITGEQTKILQGHGFGILCVTFSPDGHYIASGSWNIYKNNLMLWDALTGELVESIKGHVDDKGANSLVSCVMFNHSGNELLSCSSTGLLLSNGKTGEQIEFLLGGPNHPWDISCAAFSPDNKYIISGGEMLLLITLINPQIKDFIAKKLNIAQVRLLHRLYVANSNNVPVILDKQDPDYQIYVTLPHDVQQVVREFLPFELTSEIFEKKVQEKINEYKAKFVKAKALLADKIKTTKVLIETVQNNPVEYEACKRLLNELEQEEVFENVL